MARRVISVNLGQALSSGQHVTDPKPLGPSVAEATITGVEASIVAALAVAAEDHDSTDEIAAIGTALEGISDLVTAVTDAIATADGLAAVDHDSTPEINDVAAAMAILTAAINRTADLLIDFNLATITSHNAFQSALKAAAFTVPASDLT